MTPLELNQTVYHFLYGWEGKVVAVQMQEDSPLCIQSGQDPANVDWYGMDGRMFPEDANPTWVAEPPKPYESRCRGLLDHVRHIALKTARRA